MLPDLLSYIAQSNKLLKEKKIRSVQSGAHDF
jgi:hypothetical protein